MKINHTIDNKLKHNVYNLRWSMPKNWLLMFFRKPLTTIALIASTLQAYGSGNGANPEMGYDIVSSMQKCIAVHKRTENQVALVLEDKCNRVGFSRVEYESKLKEFGFFWEWSRDSMLFDSDPEMYMNFTKLSLEAANQIVEYNIMQNFIMNSGSSVYSGGGSSVKTTTGDLTYDFIMDLYDMCYENRVPDQTRIIKGSRNIDTVVASNGYFVYIPHKLARKVMELKDNDGNRLFVGVEHYAYSGSTREGRTEAAMGEIGKIGKFRFIEVRNMTEAMYYDDATKKIKTAKGVYPLVIVGEDAAKGVTLHTNKRGKGRYEIIVKKPGYQTADRHDPYGKTGFYSIQWWDGFLAQRPERIVTGYVKVA